MGTFGQDSEEIVRTHVNSPWFTCVGLSALALVLGVAVGLNATLFATRLLANQVYGVRSVDPTAFVILVVLTAGVLPASNFPARRATRVDPQLVALRFE
jgi:ABC-type lipoprotein release transport system permease subunit